MLATATFLAQSSLVMPFQNDPGHQQLHVGTDGPVFIRTLICGTGSGPAHAAVRHAASCRRTCMMISAFPAATPQLKLLSSLPCFHVEWQAEGQQRSDDWNAANVRRIGRPKGRNPQDPASSRILSRHRYHAAYAGCEIPRWDGNARCRRARRKSGSGIKAEQASSLYHAVESASMRGPHLGWRRRAFP